MIPMIHAESSAKRYGGVPEDYLDIHKLMDSTKAAYPNNAHRVITHNSWFVVTIIPLVFGETRINSEGKKYSTKDVAEYHVLEDFRNRFIPSIQDYLEHLDFQPWMNNGGDVPNRLKVKSKKSLKKIPAPENILTQEELNKIDIITKPESGGIFPNENSIVLD